jgi:hypothetical protein
VDLRNHVLAVDDDGRSFGSPQCNVQDRSILRDIDFLPLEHGIDTRSQTRLFGQLKKQLESFVGNTVLRVIQKNSHGFGRHALAALGIIRKNLSEM